MSAELLALLDELDAAREKATPGEWYQARHIHVFSENESRPGIGQMYIPGDAALIVAAVNSLPKLTAALRQVAAIADVWDGIADMWTESAEHPSAAPGPREMARGEAFDFRERARVLRAAIAAALTPEQADR